MTRPGLNTRLFVMLAVALGMLPLSAQAQGIKLLGKWACRMGVMRIHQDGARVVGKLIWANEKTCPFKRGDEILEGALLEDSLSGRWRYCLKGKECDATEWAPLVMLIARGGRVLSGAAHYKDSGCSIGGKRKGDGVIVRKLRRKPKRPKEPHETASAKVEPGMKDEDGQAMEEEVKPLRPEDYEQHQDKWLALMQEGKGFMDQGFFERARKKFRKASGVNPTRTESFNGVGVTFYARGDYEEALNWYKKALEVDPDFGDAFYNMACVYSLLKKKELAFRYLGIAVLNGYVQHQAMEQDPDLNNLRADPRYAKILAKMKKKSR